MRVGLNFANSQNANFAYNYFQSKRLNNQKAEQKELSKNTSILEQGQINSLNNLNQGIDKINLKVNFYKNKKQKNLKNSKEQKIKSNVEIFIKKCISSLKNGASQLSRKSNKIKEYIKNNDSNSLIEDEAIKMAEQSKSQKVIHANNFINGIPEKIEFMDGSKWENFGEIIKIAEKQNDINPFSDKNILSNLKDNKDETKKSEDKVKLEYAKYKIMRTGGKIIDSMYTLKNRKSSIIIGENSIVFNDTKYIFNNGKYVSGTRTLNLDEINNAID